MYKILILEDEETPKHEDVSEADLVIRETDNYPIATKNRYGELLTYGKTLGTLVDNLYAQKPKTSAKEKRIEKYAIIHNITIDNARMIFQMIEEEAISKVRQGGNFNK